MFKRMDERLRAADRKMRKFFRDIPKKIKAIPGKLRDIGAVIAYLAKHPREIKRLLPSKTKVKRFWKRVGNVVLVVFLIGVITVSIIGCVAVVYVVNNFDGTTGLPNLNNLSMDATSIIWVQNEKNGEWVEYEHLEGVNSIWVDIEEIPRYMQQAVIAIEDERFESHYGVDWKRTIAAFANSILHYNDIEFGGSTITQQLIKVTTGENERVWTRKITEILRAVEMEKLYDKDQILEAYLNNLPLSDNVVGIGAGANYFFGKEVNELSIAECAILASITNNPSKYNPYTHPENVRQRQLLVLQKMNELGFITDDEYVQAVGEELHYKSSLQHTATWDYYVDLVIDDLIDDLQEQYGYTAQYATQLVFYGGLNIYSAEIPAQQQAVEAIFANEANFPAHLAADTEDPQASIFIMDYDGRVVATVGGRGEKSGKRDFNRSTQSYRSPGSSMKPLTAYGPAIAMDVVHWSSIVRDAPLKKLENGNMWPANYEAKPRDNGNTFVYIGLQKSLNTVAARLVDAVTPQKAFDYGTSIFKLSSLVKSQATEKGQILTDIDYAPLSLGALTKGVYARDMAAAYAVFGNGGYYNEPYTYYEVYQDGTKENGELLLRSGAENIRVLDEDSAYVMNRLMQRVTTYGTADEIGASWKGWELFGKTGTAENNNDVYFCGGTSYYVGATWFGYDNNQSLLKSQTSYAKTLWNQSMKALHKSLKPQGFDQLKGDTQELAFCTQTGDLATVKCPKIDYGVYKPSNTPGACKVHAGKLRTTTADPAKTTTADPDATTTGTAATTGAATTGSTKANTTASTAAPTEKVTTTTEATEDTTAATTEATTEAATEAIATEVTQITQPTTEATAAE